jgi:ribosome-interacting GTPase 1
MPTNLPPDAIDKWEEVEAARTPRDKMEKMIELLKYVPQHKGTLKLRGEIKRKIAIIREDLEDKKRKGTGKSSGGPKLFVEKEGSAQVAILGLTNSGKSCLMRAVTNANIVVSPTMYTTTQPVPGIMDFGDVHFQLVETPAIMEGSGDGRAWGPITLGVARNADGIILMVDLVNNPAGQVSLLISELEKSRVLVKRPNGSVEIEKRHAGTALRVILVGRLIGCTIKEVETLLRNYKIHDAIVRIGGEVTLDDIEDAVFETTTYKPAVIVANKADLPGTIQALQLLKKYVNNRIPIVPMSCEKKLGIEELGKALIQSLNIIRIYTKEPGSKTDTGRPFALKKGTSIGDLAKNIHKEFISNFLFAMVWAKRLPFSPKKVGLNFILEDGDIVEIHAR